MPRLWTAATDHFLNMYNVYIVRFLKQFWPSLLTLGVILYATLTPDPLGDETLPLIPHADKFVHAVMMGGLTGAILFDLRRRDRRERLGAKIVIAVGAGVLIFALADEWLQGQIGIGRPSDPYDGLANAAGVLVAMFTAPAAVRAVLQAKETGGHNHRGRP